MAYKASFGLQQYLRETRQMTANGEVHRHIDDALKFMASSKSDRNRYRSDRPLVDHLVSGAREAERTGEVKIAERLEDFAEYAAGEIPMQLLDTFYRPDDRLPISDKFAQVLFKTGLERAAEFVGAVLKEYPNATGKDIFRWLLRMDRNIENLEVKSGRFGGIKLPRAMADSLTWFKRIELGISDLAAPYGELSTELLTELARIDNVELLTQAVELRRRREKLTELRETVENPRSTELEIHAALKGQSWIFGGRYVDELARKRLQ